MQYDQKQFTQAGLNMFSNALSNKQSITVDKVIVDDLPTNNFSNLGLLSLDSFADAMSFQANYTETSDNTLTVDAVMSNKGFQSPYTVQEIGLVGHIGTDESTQTLIAILVASDPFTLPAQQNNETPSQFIPNITIQLANDDMGQVPVMVSNDAYIAQKDLDNLVAKNGYIKLTDADNRYVKQTDFQNEVNNSVNEKADKSDLSNLQSNINNDVQPQLSQKANQSDLNTTNGSVSSLQSNKADKGDVTGQINQTLSQATAHSDQNLSTATNHSDSNYNDLSNKNNILYDKMIAPKGNLESGNFDDMQSNGLWNLHGYFQNAPWGSDHHVWGYILVFNYGGTGVNASPVQYAMLTADDTDTSNNGKIWSRFGTGYSVIGDPWVKITNERDISDLKQSIQNKTNDLSNTMNQQFSQATAHSDQIANSKQDKIEQGSISNGDDLSNYQSDGVFAMNNIDITTLKSASGLNQTSGFYGVMRVQNYNGLTQQFVYDNWTSVWYRYASGNIAFPFNKIATQDDIASIKANTWRELTPINGASGISLCKPDFSNDRATVINTGEGISGSMAFQNDANDFNFIQEVNSTSNSYSYTIVSGNKIGRETNIAAGFGSPIGLPTEIIFQIQPK